MILIAAAAAAPKEEKKEEKKEESEEEDDDMGFGKLLACYNLTDMIGDMFSFFLPQVSSTKEVIVPASVLCKCLLIIWSVSIHGSPFNLV